MRQDRLTATQSFVWIVFAILLLVAPAALLGAFGVALTPSTTVVCRLFGAELTGLALACYVTRRPADAGVASSLAAVYSLCNALGFVCSLAGTLTGALAASGWLLVGLYLFYAFAFAWYALPRPRYA